MINEIYLDMGAETNAVRVSGTDDARCFGSGLHQTFHILSFRQ
jgi:hypothetical protein